MEKLRDSNENGSRAHQIELCHQWIEHRTMLEVRASHDTVVVAFSKCKMQRRSFVVLFHMHMTIVDHVGSGRICTALGWSGDTNPDILVTWNGALTTKVLSGLGERSREDDARHEPGRRNFTQKNQQCRPQLPFAPIAQHITNYVARFHLVGRARFDLLVRADCWNE